MDALTHYVPAGVLGIISVSPANAYVVDEISDISDGNYGLGKLSLHKAIALSNQNVGLADLITFSSAAFGSAATITVSGTSLAITDPVTINGPAQA